MSDVSVVVADLDGGALLVELLRSLEKQTLPAARIVIWDNGSSVPVEQRVNSTLPLTFLRSEVNLGFTGAVNAAMENIREPFVALINNDVTLDPLWIEVLRGVFDDPHIGAVQAVQVDGQGRIDGAGIDLRNGTIQQALHGATAPASFREPWGVSATAAMYRVEALRDVAHGKDVLDPRFFAYYEDVELCARLKSAKWGTRLVPRILATHRGSQSAGRLSGSTFLRVRNRYFVHRLHPEVGRLPALVAEDLRRLGRLFIRWDLRAIGQTIAGAAAGMTASL